ncbi:hypothetical protein GGS20DRAFT_528189 [Poronia punctata]|nr:hypothetical protein GGS20DRAFT_528189 [Poronia punctata]
MSPPLPVPSKAAIRALRGIALGTSCAALGVIVEDRRRRINTLRTAVANKERLKASKHYHQSSLEQLACKLDEAVALAPGIQWQQADASLRKSINEISADDAASKSTTTLNGESSDLFEKQETPIPSPLPQPTTSEHITLQNVSSISRRRIRVPILPKPASGGRQTTEEHAPVAPNGLKRDTEHDIADVERLLARRTQKALTEAVTLFMSRLPPFAAEHVPDKWLQLSASLCKECQSSDRWDDASRILAAVIALGRLEESLYFAHDPVAIVESHIRRRELDRPCSISTLKSAARLYLAKLNKEPQLHGADMENIGKDLIFEAFANKQYNLAHTIHRRALRSAEDPEALARWSIEAFFEKRDYKHVIKIFLLQYSHMRPSAQYFYETLDRVVESVNALNGLSATPVLAALARIECPKGMKLQKRWIIKILQAYHDRHIDLAKTIGLFEMIESVGILDKVRQPQDIHCKLIDIAIRAGNEHVAGTYADEVMRVYPTAKGPISVKLAIFKARTGDWEGVFQSFLEARAGGVSSRSLLGHVLPILREFAQSRTAAEIHQFAMRFATELDLGFHPHMVNLVAKKYGESRDMQGFMGWVEQCARAGFALEPSFCNTVLYNCWAIWKVSYPELKKLHSKFRALSPNCSDAVTQRILSQAAHRQRRVSTQQFRTRARGIRVDKMAYRGRSTNTRDVFETMNQEIMIGRPYSAIAIYKRSRRFGMPFCSHCHRLAVLAACRHKGTDAEPALALIHEAQREGHDVNHAVSVFLKFQIDQLRGSPDDVMIHMRNLIHRFESTQVIISPAVLTHMAMTCAKVGRHSNAIGLCNLARDRAGSRHFCFSKQCIKALATAYAGRLDYTSMESLIDDLSDSRFLTDKTLLLHLKSIRRLVGRLMFSDEQPLFLETLKRGIGLITEARLAARTQGKRISEATLRIVGEALADLQRDNGSKGSKEVARLGAVTHSSIHNVLPETELLERLVSVG